jgi:hypothetical protein
MRLDLRQGHILLTWALLYLWLVCPVRAETGLPFLLVGAGARGIALGEAAVALLDDEAMAANPAALPARPRRTLGLTHSAWIGDIRHDYLTLVAAGRRGVFGFSAQIARADDLEHRTGPSPEPQGRFGVYDGVLSLAYAGALGTSLRAGIGVKLIRQAVYIETATGAAVDAGLLYRLGDQLHLGLALRNFGRMSKLDKQATDLPRSGSAGASFRRGERLLVGLEVRRAAGRATSLHLGGELAVGRRLRVRGGYQTTDTRHLTLGLGLQSSAWIVDYAFIPFKSGLGEAHRFSLHWHRST